MVSKSFCLGVPSLLLMAFLLAACAPHVVPGQLGMSTSQWQQLSKKERHALAKKYQASEQKRQQWVASMTENPEDTLIVSLRAGKAYFPQVEKELAFKPVKATLVDGQCYHAITLTSMANPDDKIALAACYFGGNLLLDPSTQMDLNSKAIDTALGTVRFPFLPAWGRGFTYHNVNSRGNSRLQNVVVHLAKPKAITLESPPSDDVLTSP